MKGVKTVLIVVAVSIAMVCLIAATPWYKNAVEVNDFGQTYGSIADVNSVEDMPALIRAVGVDGVIGYIYAYEVLPEEFDTPEEALAWQEAKKDAEPYTIPLYESDGKTVIGEFLVQP